MYVLLEYCLIKVTKSIRIHMSDSHNACDTVKVFLFVDAHLRGSSKLPVDVSLYIRGFLIDTK